MLILAAVLSTAIQQQPIDIHAPKISEANVQIVREQVQQLLFVIGSCEAVLPAEFTAGVLDQFSQPPDPQDLVLLKASYEAGKASPKAATQTIQSCNLEIRSTITETQAIMRRLEDDPH